MTRGLAVAVIVTEVQFVSPHPFVLAEGEALRSRPSGRRRNLCASLQ
jgi:hypothetical protein